MLTRRLSQADAPAVSAFLASLAESAGGEVIGERKALTLRGEPDGIVLEDEGTIVGVSLWVGEDPRTFEIATTTGAHADRLVVATVTDSGTAELRAWTLRSRHAEAFEQHGFRVDRRLHEMVIDVPIAPVRAPVDLVFRGYRPGDEVAWVTVNNRSFAGHPEQGSFTVDEFLVRTRLAWWDPEGLRLAFHDGELVGSCWTKVHPDGVGEIYVIGVDPSVAGRGWGEALVREGLRHLAEVGCTRVRLFVTADNHAAMALYAKLGFDTVGVDVAWIR